MDLKTKLQRFGLSEKQAEIYLLLVEHGELRIKELVGATNIPRSSVYENLKRLQSLGLVEKVVQDSFVSIRPYPLDSVKHLIQEQIQDLEGLTSELDDLQNELQARSNSPHHSTQVRYYEGRAGARQILWNTLKTTNVIYAYSEWGRGQYVGMEFYRKFVAESYARNFREHVLINPTEHALDSLRTYMGTDISRSKPENIRAIDEKHIVFKGNTFMYDTIYAQVYLKDEQITGFEVESQQFVDTQRAIFNMLWDSAIPIQKLL